MKRAIVLLIFGALLIAACSTAPDLDQPPEIRYGEDTCERCYMIINEARFAAAYVTREGDSRRFDDIGGMLAYNQEMSEDVAVFWVHDFDTEEWLKADEAYFVESDNQHTPMGFGIVAFAGRDRAEEWAAEQDGMVMTFSELLADDANMSVSHDSEHEQ